MSNNGFKAISESLITDIQECPITRGEFGTFTYLMLKANYVTHKALGSFSSMAEDLDANRQQIANDCYNLKDYGWIDFDVKKGQRKSILFTILKGWWDNRGAIAEEAFREQHATRNQPANNSQVIRRSFASSKNTVPELADATDIPPTCYQPANNSQVSSRSVAGAQNAVPEQVDATDIPPTCYQPANNSQVNHQPANNSQVSSRLVAGHSHVSSRSRSLSETSGSVPMPADADLVSADNTEHGTQNMKQQRPRGKKGNLESPDYEDVVVSNFCYEEDSAGLGRKESPYVAELCDLFANAYGQSLPENKAHEWILEYGINRCKEVITKGNSDPDNPIGYVQKALVDNWQFKDRNAKQSFGMATPSVEATRALIDDLKATWAEKQNPTAEEMAKIDAMLINAGLKDPPKFD